MYQNTDKYFEPNETYTHNEFHSNNIETYTHNEFHSNNNHQNTNNKPVLHVGQDLSTQLAAYKQVATRFIIHKGTESQKENLQPSSRNLTTTYRNNTPNHIATQFAASKTTKHLASIEWILNKRVSKLPLKGNNQYIGRGPQWDAKAKKVNDRTIPAFK